MTLSRKVKGISTTAIVAIIAVLVVVAGLYWYFTLPPAGPEYKDTLIWGTTDSVENTIDPSQAYDFFGWCIIQQTGLTLVEIQPGSEAGPEDFIPALATDWTVSTDMKTWTFNLRQGVKFEDETEVTADDVKYSFDRANVIQNEDSFQVNMGTFDILIDSVEVTDTYQVVFHLKVPASYFLQYVACQAFAIVNPNYAAYDAITEYAEGDARASNPNDLGRYVLTKWERVAGKDVEMWLEANPNYWDAASGWPKTNKIIIKMYTDATALRLALEAGDVDVAFRHLTSTDIEDLQDNPAVEVWEGKGAAIQYLIFQEHMSPFDDARARRALAAALDRSAVCTTVFLGQAKPLYSMIPEGMMGHTEAFKALGDANTDLTKSLLAELGYDEDNKLAVDLWYESSGHYPSSADQALFYKDAFEASGVVEVTLHSADWPSYRQNRNAEVMQVYIYGWYPDYIDPDNYAFLYFATWLHHNYIETANGQAMEALWTQAGGAPDADRPGLYAQIDDMAVQDCPVIPIFSITPYAVTNLNVEGVVMDITQSWRLWLLYATVE
ncbi:MAG: ABC transporter substrate-binding protein [Candidatus Bathyarchaeota archaeon]|nr:ABC transporter substrate-binding protein [Candidatus Bathyarchaeota archaeon]